MSWDTVDFSALKTIPLRETMRLEFRGEFYSFFNHPNFLFAVAGPENSDNATVFGTPGFGFATAARDPPLVQLGLKFYY